MSTMLDPQPSSPPVDLSLPGIRRRSIAEENPQPPSQPVKDIAEEKPALLKYLPYIVLATVIIIGAIVAGIMIYKQAHKAGPSKADMGIADNTHNLAATPKIGSDSDKVLNNVYITFYGFDDNDNGAGTYGVSTISDPVIHQVATEEFGTYDKPSTFATDEQYRLGQPGTKIYVPRLRKYYILEDTCRECTADFNRGRYHVDLYMGDEMLQGQPLIDCEDTMTSGSDTIVVNPSPNYAVNTQKLFTSGKCYPQTFSVTLTTSSGTPATPSVPSTPSTPAAPTPSTPTTPTHPTSTDSTSSPPSSTSSSPSDTSGKSGRNRGRAGSTSNSRDASGNRYGNGHGRKRQGSRHSHHGGN